MNMRLNQKRKPPKAAEEGQAVIKNTIITALAFALMQSLTGWFTLPMWRLVIGVAMGAVGAQMMYRIDKGGETDDEATD